MIKKEQLFYWGHEQEEAFKKLKNKFISASILASFDPKKKIILKTKVLDQALGLYLSQPNAEGKLHPVAYLLRKFSSPELNYNIHDKELLAIINAFKEWQADLEKLIHLIVVYSNHKNLSYFTTTKKLNRQQV